MTNLMEFVIRSIRRANMTSEQAEGESITLETLMEKLNALEFK